MISEDVRGRLKQENPNEKLYEVTQGDITIVVKGADHGAWLKYRTMSMDFTGDTVKRASAAQFLCQAMLVYPTREELEAELRAKRLNGFYHSVVRQLAEISGDREGATVGEL